MSVIAIIICGLFLAAVWRVRLPNDLGQSADHEQPIIQCCERKLIVAAAPRGRRLSST